MSRRHALITVDSSGQVTIHDLKSTGGRWVNDERLEGPRALRPGDLVRFVDLVARFEPGRSPESGTGAPDSAMLRLPAGTDAPPIAVTKAPPAAATRPQAPSDREGFDDKLAAESTLGHGEGRTWDDGDEGRRPVPGRQERLETGSFGAAAASLVDVLVQRGFELAAAEVAKSDFGPTVELALRNFQAGAELPVTGVLDPATAVTLGLVGGAGRGVAIGVVVRAEGRPAAGVAVQLVARSLRGGSTVWGSAMRDESGRFSIALGARRMIEGSVPLAVVAVDDQGRTRAESGPDFSATPSLHAVLPAGVLADTTDLQVATSALAGALGDTKIASLDAGKLKFLAQATGHAGPRRGSKIKIRARGSAELVELSGWPNSAE